MTSYNYETITGSQAQNYNAATDTLAINTAGSTGAMMTVRFNPATATNVATVTLIEGVTNKAVTFGPAIYGEGGGANGGIIFPDGSNLYIGAAGDDTADTASGPTFAATAGNDGLFGNSGNDSLNAGAGDDLLQGNMGNDVLRGGAGYDTIYGGQGDDTIFVGAGLSFVNGNLGADTISAVDETSANTLLGGQANDSIVGGAGADFLNGNLGDDHIAAGLGGDNIFGEAGNDILLGMGGNDTIQGGDGTDTIGGGGGQDFLRGGNDVDTFLFTAGDSGVTPGLIDQLLDWESTDIISFAALPIGSATNVVELGAGDYAAAVSLANSQIAGGIVDYAIVQVGPDTIIFVDALNNNGTADDAVVLVGRTLADIASGNIH
jgi:Ca2+-binding RTX toxin-like protein